MPMGFPQRQTVTTQDLDLTRVPACAHREAAHNQSSPAHSRTGAATAQSSLLADIRPALTSISMWRGQQQTSINDSTGRQPSTTRPACTGAILFSMSALN